MTCLAWAELKCVFGGERNIWVTNSHMWQGGGVSTLSSHATFVYTHSNRLKELCVRKPLICTLRYVKHQKQWDNTRIIEREEEKYYVRMHLSLRVTKRIPSANTALSPNIPTVCAWSALKQIGIDTGCCHQAFPTCSVLCQTFLNTYPASSAILTAAAMISCSTSKCHIVISSVPLINIKLSCTLCIIFLLKFTVLSWRVKPRKKKRAERNREEKGTEKRRDASLAEQLRPKALRWMYIFTHEQRAENSCGYLMH